MATQNVNIGINVSDNGTAKKVVKNFKEIETAALAAKRAAEQVEAKTAGTPGSRKLSGGGSGGIQGLMDNQSYGSARGTAGLTGASARDFANQAQGLGGLVRVYATFAANLFAVSAAFTALKNAADTTNMVKGLDQLGAAAGRNLGALSLRIVDITDGAVNLREAMTATAQATAAGMSSQNFERLARVAKNASQALGVAMPDALSRLSRGITKIEPELLDEIGLFVKVDDAVTIYARSVGKAASQLTDFERRHAFAMLAIEQGEKKFGVIEMDSNPYSKLLASITNLSQKILETINVALGPLIGILSSSPTALGAAMAGISAILLKQAIPALGMYRENARMLAEETRERVAASVRDQIEAASQIDASRAMSAEKAFQNEKTTQDRIAKLQKGRFSQELLGKDLRSTLKKSAFDITPEETAALKARSQALLDSDVATQQKQGKKLQAHLAAMDALKQESEEVGNKAAAASEARDNRLFSHAKQMQMNLEKLNRDSKKRMMLADVADTAAVMGPVAAFRQLRVETSKLDASPASKTFTMLQGSIGLAGSAAMTALNAFGGWIAAIGLVTTIISTIVSWMSETKKESAETAKALDAVSSSVENVTRTLEFLNKQDPLARISITAIEARATAFAELAENIALANTRAVAELDKMGRTDKFVDWVSKLWSGDVQSKLNETTAEGFASAFTALERGPTSDRLRESFKNILGIDTIDTESIEKALDKLPEAVRKVAMNTLTKDIKAAGLAAQVTAARGKELTEIYTAATRQLQDLRTSFIPTDAVTRLGATIVSSAEKLSTALKDPVQTLNAMNAAVRDANSLSLFPAETATMLVGLKGQLEDLTQSYANTTSELENTEKQIVSLNKKREDLEQRAGLYGVERDQIKEINTELAKLASVKKVKTDLLYSVQTEVQTLGKQFDQVLTAQFAYGAKLISDRLSAEWSKAGSIIGNAIAGMLGDTEAGIRMRAKYETLALEGQREQIRTQILLIQSNERLAIAIEQDSLNRQVAALGPNIDTKDLRPYADRQIALDRRRGVLDNKVTRGATARLAEDINKNVMGARESLTYVQAAESAFAQMAGISAQISAVAIKTSVELARRYLKLEEDQVDAAANRLKLSKDGLSTLETIIGADSVLLLRQKQRVEIQELEFQNQKKSFDLRVQLRSQEILLDKEKNNDNKALIRDEIKIVKEKQKQLETDGKIAKSNLDNKQTLEASNVQFALQTKEQERLFTRLQETQAIETDRLNNADMQLESAKQRNAISEQGYLREKLLLDNDKARLETQTRIDQIRKGANDITAGAEQIISQSQTALRTATPEQQTALNEKIREQQTLIERTNESSDSQVQSLLTQLGIRTQLNSATTAQAVALEKVATATQSLSALFGDLGTKIGETVSELVKYSMGSDAMAERHAKSLAGMDKESQAYKDKFKENTEERTKFEITGQMKAAGVAKGMFKEKTLAFKVLNNLEKIRAAQSIALSIKEAAVKLGLITQVQVASFAASAKDLAMQANNAMLSIGINIPKIYAATIGQLGIFGPPVAAAMIAAFVGSAFGSKGGGFAPTAEQRQETQGTAMGYNDRGQKVQVRRGVFGDTEAKSESIANSLELIRENSVDGLSYDNRMLKALESIDRGINNAAKGLFSIQGLRTGSMFGTVQGSQSGGGLLGTGFLGSKTSRNITDSGLLIEGTFAQLASDTNKAVIDFFEQVTVSKRSWYGKTRTWVETQRTEIDDATSGFFKDIFGNATKLFIEVGSKAGISQQAVSEILGNLDVGEQFASLRGLKGEEFQKELSAIIGTILDDAGSAIFPQFEKFANFGEGMLETVVRVVDSNEKALQSLSNIGVKLSNTSFDTTETLAELAGGIENFLDKNKFFAENFLTEAERLAPVQKAVTDELTRLGFATVDTREEFKQLVQSLDLTTDSGRDNFEALMNVAEGFDQVTSAAEDAADKLKTTQQSLLDQVLELTGTASEILAASRARTLSETPEELRALQNYVFALEDVKTAESNLTKARETEVNRLKQQKSVTESTVGSIKNYINSLQKFRQSLLLGADSPLTPAERYTESKRQFDTILATAMGTATTPEEQRVKDAALSQLEGASSSFLEASKVYNASSAQYMNDFNLVQRALLDTEGSLALQLSVEEKSLKELESQTTLLEDQIAATNKVSSSILTLADAIAQLDTAKAGLATASASVGTQLTGAGGGSIIGNKMYGLKGNTGVVEGAGGGREGTTNFMRMVERGEQTAAELRRIYVEDWGYDSKIMAHIAGMTQQEVLAWFKRMDPSLPTFAKGTNYVPGDMLAQIHEGERIVPAADNAELMQSIGNRNRTNEVLVSEIKKLNQKIESLERVVAEGAVINAEATNRNTVEISRTVKDTGSTASHSEAIRRRTQIV
jgi:hypothetical protein